MEQLPPDNQDDLPCKVQIGFLFKRTCGRMDRVGCKYCHGQVLPASSDVWTRDLDPYFLDRSYYQGYGYYGLHHSDFTDADSSSVAPAQDTDFEQDLSGS